MRNRNDNIPNPNKQQTNAEVLGQLLKNFDTQEDFMQEQVAEYIACPKAPYMCEHYGEHYAGCTACKVQWLKQKWDT